jgi:hypothetical protein
MLDESRSDEIKISDVISSIRLLNKLQLKKDEKARQMRYGGAGSTLSWPLGKVYEYWLKLTNDEIKQ